MYSNIKNDTKIPEKARYNIERRVNKDGGFQKYFLEHRLVIIPKITKEEQVLRAKRSVLANKKAVDGDLSQDFWCNVAASTLVAGMFSGNAFAVGFGIGLALGSDC